MNRQPKPLDSSTAAHWHVFARETDQGSTSAFPDPLTEPEAGELADELVHDDIWDIVWIHGCPEGCMFLGHSDSFDPDEAEPYWMRESVLTGPTDDDDTARTAPSLRCCRSL
jgi:hypothetical protein